MSQLQLRGPECWGEMRVGVGQGGSLHSQVEHHVRDKFATPYIIWHR